MPVDQLSSQPEPGDHRVGHARSLHGMEASGSWLLGAACGGTAAVAVVMRVLVGG